MKKVAIAEVVEARKEEGVQALIWDGASGHRAKIVKAVGVPLIASLAYSAEFSSAERVFEELRWAIEGEVYGQIEAKVAAVERHLEALANDLPRLQRLVG